MNIADGSKVKELEAELELLEQRLTMGPEIMQQLIDKLGGATLTKESQKNTSKSTNDGKKKIKKLTKLFKEGYNLFLEAIKLAFGYDQKTSFEVKTSEIREFIRAIKPNDVFEDITDEGTLMKAFDDDSVDGKKIMKNSDGTFDVKMSFIAELIKMTKQNHKICIFDILKKLGGIRTDVPIIKSSAYRRDEFNKFMNNCEDEMSKLKKSSSKYEGARRLRALFHFKIAYESFDKAFSDIFDRNQTGEVSIVDVEAILTEYTGDGECIIGKACADFEMTPRFENTFYSTVTIDSFLAGISLILKDFYSINSQDDNKSTICKLPAQKKVTILNNRADFATAKNSKNLSVVDFFATWCPPCQYIAPLYEDLSAEFSMVNFYKVDVDKNREASSDAGIRAMPTFKLYKGGVEMASLEGANVDDLKELIKEWSDVLCTDLEFY